MSFSKAVFYQRGSQLPVKCLWKETSALKAKGEVRGSKERKGKPVGTIMWSCAFPLRFVRSELTTEALTVFVASSVSISFKLNWRERVIFFPVYSPFKGHFNISQSFVL